VTTTRERTALARLLTALDRSAPELPRLLARPPRTGDLFGLCARERLSAAELRLLLLVLAERLDGRPCITGSELARRAAADSAGRLAALALLTTEARLLGAGLLLPESLPADGVAAQATLYRLSDHVFRIVCDIFARRVAPAEDPAGTTPYRSNAELLADLRRLSLLYRRRAAVVFQLDPWSGTGLPVADGASVLLARARAHALRTNQRLALTPASDALPLLRLREQHGLDLDALLILVTMLYQELVEGVGSVDAVDLVKLVSESEEDLLRRRHLLRPLQRRGLLVLDGAFSGKELTADASLPNGVVDLMLGAGAPIGSNERIDFHAWLSKLDSGDPFFTEPGADPGL
jgi:hypothetical protein